MKVVILFFSLLTWGSLARAQENMIISTIPVAPALTAEAEDHYRTKLEKETYHQINAFRLKKGLNHLLWSDEIATIARQHSRKMALEETDFGHDGFSDRAKKIGEAMPNANGFGENVFMADYEGDLSGLAVEKWLQSPHHYKNIVGEYTHTGMGVWRNRQGYTYFTQIFVKVEAPAVPQ